MLNQVESPNYGRYKVVSVNDVGTYVSIVVVFQIGEGTLLEGDTVALQAFPASSGGSGGIPEAPIDGKQYGRQDATWTEVEGGGSGWKETVLFENEAGQTTNFALSESYDSFDYLRFDTIKTDGTADGNLKRSDMFPVDICNRLVIDNYYNFYMYLNCDDKTNFTVVGADTVALLKVVGINTGSGGGSGDSVWEVTGGGNAKYDGAVISTQYFKSADGGTTNKRWVCYCNKR